MLDGKKVKLNTEWMNGKMQNPVFIRFIEANKDRIFTARLAWGYTSLYTLDEDESPVKWLFSEQGLIKVDD